MVMAMVMATIVTLILTATVITDTRIGTIAVTGTIVVTGTIIIGVGDRRRGWRRQWVTTQAHWLNPPFEALSTSPWLATPSRTIPESSSILLAPHSRELLFL